MSDSKEVDQMIGCGLTVWSLVVTQPCWLVLFFMVMQSCELPTWCWVLYWVYVPVSLLGIITAGIARPLLVSK